MQTEKVKERFRLQREKLGLPPKEEVLLGSDGMVASEQQVAEQIAQFDQDLEKGEDLPFTEEAGGMSEEDPAFMEEQPARQGKVVL